MKEKTNHNINFNAEPQDHLRLEAARLRLSLTRSEVARRALRLGLTKLERFNLPGSPEQRETHTD